MTIDNLPGFKSDKQYQNIHFRKKGGMGEIYTAIDITTGNTKAIKIIPIENNEEYELLKSEFEISIELKHPNVVVTEYYNEFYSAGVRYLYCVMEWYDKGSLRDLLKGQTKQLTLKESLKLITDLARGLEYAHNQVVHRDLKPENSLVGVNGELLICDFGLAKLIDAKTRTKTFKGSGTLPYMSPECWILDANTAQMDIYSLGIIFYEILTLKMPFSGKTETEFRDKHLYDQLPDISTHRVDLPPRLIDMINKMTNKRPSERYNSMNEVVSTLESINQNTTDASDDSTNELLSKAQRKVSESEKQQLQQKKEQEKLESAQRFKEVAINSLFEKIEKRINSLNANLEREKIQISRNSNQFSARFLDKSFGINFYPSSDIPEVLRRNKEASIQFQIQKYGMVLQPPQQTNLEKDNVILIGQVALNNRSYNQESWGYNLVLRKADENDLYGEWWVAWFDDSGMANKRTLDYHYPIGIPEFYKEYEFGRGRVMHVRTMGFNTLESEGFDRLLEKILE